MSKVYEYRRAPTKGPIWLAWICVVLLLVAVLQFGKSQFELLAWGIAAAMIAWLVAPRRVSGIRVDDEHLTLNAWRKPRPIPLDDIAHLKVDESGLETQVTIIYRNGDKEAIFPGDLPDVDTLIVVMAERGVPVRETL